MASTEVDIRMFGMVVALAGIWLGFDILSGGDFLTARNLWNLSVQSVSIAIMATGMVLIIVSRNIDLSVGSQLGFIGYTMAMVQIDWIPNSLGLGFDRWYTWIVAVAIGIALGAGIGGCPGVHRRLRRRAVVHRHARRDPDLARSHLPLRTGSSRWRRWTATTSCSAADREVRSASGAAGCRGRSPVRLIVFGIVIARRRRRRYQFAVRPLGVDIGLGVIGCLIVLGAVWLANSYPWPAQLASQYAERHGIVEPEGGLKIPTGIAYPVVILIGVALIMTYVARRRRFGRYVYAIGGNPEAAELGGINVRRTIMLTFVLMGVLCAISAAVQTARLNAAVTGLGVSNELDVISAAVVGGTSFAGGIGTIPGAVLGAVVMQSLRSGMVLLKVDSPTQDVYVGIVLVVAVGIDSWVRRRAR